MTLYLKVAAALTLASLAIPSQAATVVFSGSRTNVDAAGPAAERCGSRATSNIRNEPPLATASGTSNFGSFTPTLSHCITLPLNNSAPNVFDLGEFLFAFENGDTLFGTYSGELSFLSAGIYSVFQTHLVTGGTGAFLDASGTFTSSGQLTFPLGRPTVTQNFSGLLNLPAVPEPSTWLTMLIGFGVIGRVMRRRREERIASLLPQLG